MKFSEKYSAKHLAKDMKRRRVKRESALYTTIYEGKKESTLLSKEEKPIVVSPSIGSV